MKQLKETKEWVLKHKWKLIGAGIAWKLLVLLTVYSVKECSPKHQDKQVLDVNK